jgi:hypothetical protein
MVSRASFSDKAGASSVEVLTSALRSMLGAAAESTGVDLPKLQATG